nr:helix-turn-helix domain-containing protein [Treponema sp.]
MDCLKNQMNFLPTILDYKDIQSVLRISNRSMYRILQDPLLKAYKVEGEGWMVNKEDFIEWLELQQDN